MMLHCREQIATSSILYSTNSRWSVRGIKVGKQSGVLTVKSTKRILQTIRSSSAIHNWRSKLFVSESRLKTSRFDNILLSATVTQSDVKLSRDNRGLGVVDIEHRECKDSSGDLELSTKTSGNVEGKTKEIKNVLFQKGKSRRSIKREKTTYLFSAIAFSVGVTGLAFAATYSRFTRHLTEGQALPWLEICGTLLFIAGAAVLMELWALWAHRALWHESGLWSLHKSHHEARTGPFEENDIFAIINAVPAILLIAFGFFNDGIVPGLCYGAGLGITCFGMLYMFVHDGLVHKRFPVGPVGDVPYLKRVAAAHKVHHTDEFEGVPYGLFLGPWELSTKEGGPEAIEKILELGEKKIERLKRTQSE